MTLVSSPRRHAASVSLFVLASIVASVPPARAQCPTEPTLQNFTGAGSTVCPCFVAGEQAGAVFTAPAANYPIQILRIGVGWGSSAGGAPASVEAALHVYPAGLPNPGAPLFTLDSPQLVDGFINEFNIESEPEEAIINSGPFMVALQFANSNAGDPFAPTVIHDGNGCQAGKNTIFAIPGGWLSACAAGVTGDWVFYVTYRRVDCQVGVETLLPEGTAATLFAPRPNPARAGTACEFVVPRSGLVSIAVFDVHGRLVRELASGWRPAGRHSVSWDGADREGARAAAGMYLIQLTAGGVHSARKVSMTE